MNHHDLRLQKSVRSDPLIADAHSSVRILVLCWHTDVGEAGEGPGAGHFWDHLYWEVARGGCSSEVCTHKTAGRSRELPTGSSCAGVCATSQCHALLWYTLLVLAPPYCIATGCLEIPHHLHQAPTLVQHLLNGLLIPLQT